MLFKFNYYNFEKFLVVIFISSLPFYSFRFFSGNLSITHILFFLVAFLGFLKIFSGKFVFNKLDISIFIYIFIILFNIFIMGVYDKYYELLKIIIYFLLYFLFKQLYFSFQENDKKVVLIVGSVFGIVFFAGIVLKAVFNYGIYYNLNNLVYFVFRDLFSSMNYSEDFSGRQIMITFLGETFAFYTFVLFFLKYKKNIKYFYFLSAIFVILMHSLRSYISVFSIIFKSSFVEKFLIFLFFVVVGVVFWPTFVETFQSGIYGSSDTGILANDRIRQYLYVINNLSVKEIFFGYGFASRINDQYVHNFIFSSLYTMGVFGLIFSCCIMFIVTKWYIKFFVSNEDFFGCILIIPILGLMLGSTLEGIFTIPSWLCITVFQTKST